MNKYNYVPDKYNYVPDGAHRHPELEKIQRDIMQQHKYLETQLNSLRDNIQNVCNYNGLNCGSGVNNGGLTVLPDDNNNIVTVVKNRKSSYPYYNNNTNSSFNSRYNQYDVRKF